MTAENPRQFIAEIRGVVSINSSESVAIPSLMCYTLSYKSE
jgi:hypothetical protein